MNKFYKLLFLIPIFIVGCKSNSLINKDFIQVIDNIDMNIFSNDGEKLFSIKSPSSSYENNSNILKLEETTILTLKNNETEYIINSDKSKLSNNKLLELNGNVSVKNLTQEADKLYANSFTWDISNTEYVLIGNVKFENNTLTLSSNKAILNNADKIIKFFSPVKYKIKGRNKETVYEINSDNAYYNINTNSVSFTSKEDKVRSKIYF